MWTAKQLHSMFYYDEDDGCLYCREDGRIAGTEKGHTHTRVTITSQDRRYAHDIIWCMIYGEWPQFQIEHKDTNGHNNRRSNLRRSTQSQNMMNRTYGPMRGIEKRGFSYRVRLEVNGERISLGSYSTLEEAQAAYQEGAELYFGEFAEHNRVN